MNRTCAIIPAFNAALTIGDVVHETLHFVSKVFVIDDGSIDETTAQAMYVGAEVLKHPVNCGKGAALRTGLKHAHALGFERAISLDADGQHCPSEIPKLLHASENLNTFVLGIRNLEKAGAPKSNQLSNHFSNRYLSTILGLELLDTQCGMRCYPIAQTLALNTYDSSFGFEAEILIVAIRAKLPIVQVPIDVRYPANRTTHFDTQRDPWRIAYRRLKTLLSKP